MEQEKMQEFKQLLEAKKNDIIKQLDSIGSRVEGGAEINFNADFPDYGNSQSIEDNASEVADYTTNLSLERELEGDLRDVEKALKQIEDGSYGSCKYCKKDIEIERLKIRPQSTACVSCKNSLKNLA
jgi:RNA polymerase-binding transcription factor DksA